MGTFDGSLLFELSFFIALLFFTIHTVVISYHWLSYGAKRSQSLVSITVYIGGGAFLFLGLAMTLFLL